MLRIFFSSFHHSLASDTPLFKLATERNLKSLPEAVMERGSVISLMQIPHVLLSRAVYFNTSCEKADRASFSDF